MKVLIAEDEAISRRLLQSYLERWGHEVVSAQNGAEAWNLFEAGEFPIVISDWMMPEMDGLELMRRIRSCSRPGYVYTILVTAKAQKEDIVEGMEAGADDFVTKPFDRDELRVRLRAGQRIIELEAALYASMKELAEVHRREVEIGAKIQQTLLLGQPPQSLPNAQVAALTIPSQHIDGDFYDFFQHSETCFDVVVGDVMGKGIPAALLGAAIKAHFLRALSHLLSTALPEKRPTPEEIVTLVHDEVTRQFIGLEFFATLCYARFDLAQQHITFVDCGHTKTIHFRQGAGVCETLEGENMALGISEKEVYRQVIAPLENGDLFLFYSDGITEAKNAAGELFGVERLMETVRAYQTSEPASLLNTVRQSVVAFSNAEIFADDLTCVAVKIGTDRPTPPDTRAASEFSSQLTELAAIRAFVRRFCQNLAPAPEAESISQLELAVTEAASNVMRHAYQGRTDGSIQVEVSADAAQILIRIHHFGASFDPASAKPPTFDGSREGGFGVYMIAESMDDVRYSCDAQGRNTICLVKNRRSSEG